MDAFKKGANLSAVRMLFTNLRKERDGRLKERIILLEINRINISAVMFSALLLRDLVRLDGMPIAKQLEQHSL